MDSWRKKIWFKIVALTIIYVFFLGTPSSLVSQILAETDPYGQQETYDVMPELDPDSYADWESVSEAVSLSDDDDQPVTGDPVTGDQANSDVTQDNNSVVDTAIDHDPGDLTVADLDAAQAAADNIAIAEATTAQDAVEVAAAQEAAAQGALTQDAAGNGNSGPVTGNPESVVSDNAGLGRAGSGSGGSGNVTPDVTDPGNIPGGNNSGGSGSSGSNGSGENRGGTDSGGTGNGGGIGGVTGGGNGPKTDSQIAADAGKTAFEKAVEELNKAATDKSTQVSQTQTQIQPAKEPQIPKGWIGIELKNGDSVAYNPGAHQVINYWRQGETSWRMVVPDSIFERASMDASGVGVPLSELISRLKEIGYTDEKIANTFPAYYRAIDDYFSNKYVAPDKPFPLTDKERNRNLNLLDTQRKLIANLDISDTEFALELESNKNISVKNHYTSYNDAFEVKIMVFLVKYAVSKDAQGKYASEKIEAAKKQPAPQVPALTPAQEQATLFQLANLIDTRRKLITDLGIAGTVYEKELDNPTIKIYPNNPQAYNTYNKALSDKVEAFKQKYKITEERGSYVVSTATPAEMRTLQIKRFENLISDLKKLIATLPLDNALVKELNKGGIDLGKPDFQQLITRNAEIERWINDFKTKYAVTEDNSGNYVSEKIVRQLEVARYQRIQADLKKMIDDLNLNSIDSGLKEELAFQYTTPDQLKSDNDKLMLKALLFALKYDVKFIKVDGQDKYVSQTIADKIKAKQAETVQAEKQADLFQLANLIDTRRKLIADLGIAGTRFEKELEADAKITDRQQYIDALQKKIDAFKKEYGVSDNPDAKTGKYASDKIEAAKKQPAPQVPALTPAQEQATLFQLANLIDTRRKLIADLGIAGTRFEKELAVPLWIKERQKYIDALQEKINDFKKKYKVPENPDAETGKYTSGDITKALAGAKK